MINENLNEDIKEYNHLVQVELPKCRHGVTSNRFYQDNLLKHKPGDRIYFVSKLDQWANTGATWKKCAPIVRKIRELLLRNEPKRR